MIEHVFAKNSSEKMKEHMIKTFGDLEPISKMKPNRYELPLTSIRRILGDKFYEMKDTSDDLIRLVVYENGGFNIDEMKVNVDKASELVSFISLWYQGFMEANNYSTVFSPEFLDRKVAKVCVTSTKGLKTKEISMNDIKSISIYGDNGVILGMKNVKELSQISLELQKNEQAFKQMQTTGNQQGLQALNTQREEYLDKIAKLQAEIIEDFYKLIVDWSEFEIDDIYDVSIMFGINTPSENKESTISQLYLFTYHDGSAKTVINLKRKFGLDVDIE